MNVNLAPRKDADLNRYAAAFEKSHKFTAMKFCRKNGIKYKHIRCIYTDKYEVEYTYMGETFLKLNMKMVNSEKFKVPIRVYKTYFPISYGKLKQEEIGILVENN